MNSPRVAMPQRPPRARVKDFDEVAMGFSHDDALMEAARCRLCVRAPCIAGCPVGIDILGFITALREDRLDKAYEIVIDRNVLPSICGRVCPQDEQCERDCILDRKHDPIAIGALERFVGDWGRIHHNGNGAEKPRPEPGGRVAVVGSGPAGLTAAQDLASMGHDVTIFEALHRPGGVLVYGIPRFRLPLEVIDEEIETIINMGVKLRTNFVVGRTATLDDLTRDFGAVFLATGAGLPSFLGIPGESLVGVFSGNEFLMRVNLMDAHLFPKADTPVYSGRHIVVVGGGDTSLDCARTAARLGAEVRLLYRRSRELMPARTEEIEHALEEGVELQCETTPVRILGEEGKVAGIECVRLGAGEPDASGRARPVPIPGSEYSIPADSVIIAIGFGVNPTVSRADTELVTNAHDVVWTDDHGATSKRGVFAGGDLATGGATVIVAMAHGRRAAHAIDAYLRGRADELESRSASWL